MASLESQRALAAFPAAEVGHERWVIWLESEPSGAEESSLMVQMRVGVSGEVDGVNRYRLSGELLKRSVEGWGFDSYYYGGESQVASTRMGTQGATAREAFVWGEPQLIRYNSRLPLVIYLPVHLRLSYRVLAPVTEYDLVSAG